MKKCCLKLSLVLILMLSAGCSSHSHEGFTYSEYAAGVDVKYLTQGLSSHGTTGHLIPKDFLTKFEYGNNKFYWYTNEKTFSFGDMDKTLVYLEYADDIYEKAKSYILNYEGIDLSQEMNYNDYIFHFNEDFPHPTNFPFGYLMAGYNDTKNTLIFLGMSCAENKYPDLEYGKTDFGKYLKIFFGEFYDFDA